MKCNARFIYILTLCIFLSSCEFHCNIGATDNDGKNKAIVKDGVHLYNGIRLNAYKVKVNKAYLTFDGGERVPDDNFIGEYTPVQLVVLIDSGWMVENQASKLGASEKVTAEDGSVLLDEEDLFQKKGMENIDEKDAHILGIKVSLRLSKKGAPQTYTVSFRIWDKLGDAYVEGDYQLFSK